jgi:hypothetical protein
MNADLFFIRENQRAKRPRPKFLFTLNPEEPAKIKSA